MSVRTAGAARVAMLALLWGSSFLWIKFSLEAFTPVQITVIRMALGAAVLLTILLLRGLRLPKGSMTWVHLVIAALFGNAIPYLLFGIAEQTISSGAAGVINATAPLWTVLITVLAYRNGQAARRNSWSLGLGFLGAVLIFSPWLHGSELASAGGLACLGAAASYGVSYVYIGRFLAKRELGSLRMAAGQLLCATAITVAAVPFFGWTAPQIEVGPVLALAVLGVFGTGIAYILNYRIIADDGPTAASIVVYLLPLVSVALGALVLGERVGAQVLAGMAIVLIAAKLRRADRAPTEKLNLPFNCNCRVAESRCCSALRRSVICRNTKGRGCVAPPLRDVTSLRSLDEVVVALLVAHADLSMAVELLGDCEIGVPGTDLRVLLWSLGTLDRSLQPNAGLLRGIAAFHGHPFRSRDMSTQ